MTAEHLFWSRQPRAGFALVVAISLGMVCPQPPDAGPLPGLNAVHPPVGTTYGRMLPRASAGDAETQNLLGYMFFFGEGVERDIEFAHQWFHFAAEQGHSGAQRNLAVLHAGSVPAIPFEFVDFDESLYWLLRADPTLVLPAFQRGGLCERIDCPDSGEQPPPPAQGQSLRPLGEHIARLYCAGCHPPNLQPVPAYLGSPQNSTPFEAVAHRRLQQALGPELYESAQRHVPTGVTVADGNQGRDAGNENQGEPPDPGKALFNTFCAGCHGFNGIAYFALSPSFTLGERMDKTDAELLRSIAYGRGAMPGWSGKLSDRQLHSVLGYIRKFPNRHRQGISMALEQRPHLFFVFRPIEDSAAFMPKP